MPSWRVHRYVDKLFLEKSYYKVHEKIDEPFKYLGKNHRILFHDLASCYIIARQCYPNDPNADWAAFFHVYFDNLCTEDPEYRRFLESMELLSRGKKKKPAKKTRKRKTPEKDPLARDIRRLKKLMALAKAAGFRV